MWARTVDARCLNICENKTKEAMRPRISKPISNMTKISMNCLISMGFAGMRFLMNILTSRQTCMFFYVFFHIRNLTRSARFSKLY